MDVIELFGGIGACTQALKRLGKKINIVDYVELDKNAVKSYNAMNGTNFEPQDVSLWNKDVKADLIMHGSPCQDFSIAGTQLGADEGSGTRSSLMYETVRIVEKVQPKYVVWENVRNVLSDKHIHNFNKYLKKMEDLGYKNYYSVLNSKNFGIPQSRERVFVVSIKGSGFFVFPVGNISKPLKDFMETSVDESLYLDSSNTSFSDLQKSMFTDDLNVKRYVNSDKVDTFGKNCIADISFPNGYNKGIRVNTICPTINKTTTKSNFVYKDDNGRIRKITSKECWRLLGFSDENYEKAKSVVSDTTLFNQAGNSIVVDVLYYIFKELL